MSFSQICPACNNEGTLRVIRYTLSATGQVVEDNARLEADGFEVNAPDDLKDCSTEDELIKCSSCGAILPLELLAAGDAPELSGKKAATLLLMVDGDLAIDAYLIDRAAAQRIEDADDGDEEAETVIESGEGIILKCGGAVAAMEWAGENDYWIIDEIHHCTT